MNETWTKDELPASEPAAPNTAQYGPYVVALLVVTICLAWTSRNDRKSRLQVPGPRGLPIFGNILEFRHGYARIFDAWTQKYQDIFRVVLGNKEVVLLNTRAAVAKTLLQQGTKYQSRPEWDVWHDTFVHSANTGGVLTIGSGLQQSYMTNSISLSWFLASKWTPDISKLRKLLAPHTTAHKLPRYSHFVSRRYHRLIRMLAEATPKPQDLGYHWWSTTIGLETDQLVGHIHDDDFVRLMCETEISIFRLRSLGFPFGDWVPLVRLSETLSNAIISRLRHVYRLFGIPIPQLLLNSTEEKCNMLRTNQSVYCKQQLAGLTERVKNGDTTPFQLGDLFRALEEPLPYSEEYLLMTTLTGSGMAAGTTLNWLMGYMASHPELQEKAYNAIHKVYQGQVPDPHDTDRVEYLKALALEAGRYWIPIRLGFFRETNEDSHVDNHFVPQGTTVVYNSFQVNRDPTGYNRPNQFIPERWLDGHQGHTIIPGVVGTKIGVPHMGHGLGRRYCLGVPNVNRAWYGVLALTLHFFKLERAELNREGMKSVFPAFRGIRQSTLDMDPIDDQVSPCDGQAVPCATGIRLTPRDPEQLAAWISEGHRSLEDFVAPWAK